MSIEPTLHWKGQSRVQKCCHWCMKKQGSKSFQECARCREVIYCSKECQVASWPHHKTGCNWNAKNKEALRGLIDPETAKIVVNFKKWHGSHVPAFRTAVICALDLGNHPSRVDDWVVYLEVKLKPDHNKLPPNQKFEPVKGDTLMMDQALQRIGLQAAPIIESTKQNSAFWKTKGGIGIGIIIVQAYDFCDVIKVPLPCPEMAKLAQQVNKWGENWVASFGRAVSG